MSIEFDYPLAAEITRNVDAALAEDIGPGDLTAGLVPADRIAHATVISREPGVTIKRTSGCTLRPFITAAAAAMSSSRPLAHEPRYA